jgi:membrane carboxypeptidase/penicillin-binding protein PbpC
MTRIGRMKLALHRKPHRAAKAGTVVFHRQHSIVTPKIRKKYFLRCPYLVREKRPRTNASPHFVQLQAFNPRQRNADGTLHHPLQRNAAVCI